MSRGNQDQNLRHPLCESPWKMRGDVKTDGKDGRGLRDGLVFVGTILALLLVMSVTPNRLMQAGGAVAMRSPVLHTAKTQKSFLL
jgi:hypothetical protein